MCLELLPNSLIYATYTQKIQDKPTTTEHMKLFFILSWNTVKTCIIKNVLDIKK